MIQTINIQSVDANYCPGGVLGYKLVIRNANGAALYNSGMMATDSEAIPNPPSWAFGSFSAVSIDKDTMPDNYVNLCYSAYSKCGWGPEACCEVFNPLPPTITCSIVCS